MGSNGNVDNVSPNGKWEFDSEVARCFANMLERSIPDYRSMRSLVYEIGRNFGANIPVISSLVCPFWTFGCFEISPRMVLGS